MSEYLVSIINDEAFRLTIITFSGLYFSFYLVGFGISLVISLLYKIIRHD